MTEVRFYHLTRTALEAALPQMLEKTLERGQRAIVMAGSPERVEALNAWLWTYRDHSFLPHGAARDGHAADQPVWLTDKDENPNGAQVLFLTDGAESAAVAGYELCAVLFDGTSEPAVAAARASWTGFKDAGHAVTYWQQDDRGRWAQQA
jgi:DNA polymerase-3 subunit chi